MMQFAAWALVGSFGLWLFLRSAFPPRPTLGQLLTQTKSPESDGVEGLRSFWARVGLGLIKLVQGDKLEHGFLPDLAINQIDIEDFARDKLNAAIGGAFVIALPCLLVGWVGSMGTFVFVGVIGFVGGFLLPDLELIEKSRKRRMEFSEALTAFISLVAVCLSGGGGVNSALSDALSVGGPWPFQMLKANLDESTVRGESYWSGFDRLGREVNVEELIELAGALGLAGNSGARVTETLQARAESSRDRERQAILTEAQKRSERLNVPIAILALTWMAFITYPAIQNLVGS